MREVQLLPEKKLRILCKGVVSFKDGDKSRFVDHINNDHDAYLGINFLFVGSLMSQEEIMAV